MDEKNEWQFALIKETIEKMGADIGAIQERMCSQRNREWQKSRIHKMDNEDMLDKIDANAQIQKTDNEEMLVKVDENAEKQNTVNENMLIKVNDNFELQKTDNENMLDKLDKFQCCCNIIQSCNIM